MHIAAGDKHFDNNRTFSSLIPNRTLAYIVFQAAGKEENNMHDYVTVA